MLQGRGGGVNMITDVLAAYIFKANLQMPKYALTLHART